MLIESIHNQYYILVSQTMITTFLSVDHQNFGRKVMLHYILGDSLTLVDYTMCYISPSASSFAFGWPYIFETYSLANPIKKNCHFVTIKFSQRCGINLATMCDRSTKNNTIAREIDLCIALVNYMNFKFNFPWYGLGMSFKSPHNFVILASWP